ncbi:acyl-CoA dehydrogenase [Polaromonas sp. SM01]|uniref:acyl-CoA dehydrogenase family protein n=1 Tax=Polaromonas sp. SM01 TaxID=3085630 RepID=UPI00298285E4|nr:acyl-CoA dehydrogenase [Polaromonas sp. SM01]MDW5444149.1 acyl-CoA dehydrogenase [Polaromonas sp. SM01]
MNFTYSEEQRMLTESLRRFIETEYGFEKRRRVARTSQSFDPATWAQLADLGVLGLGIPTEHGGFGESAATQLVVQRELGRGLVLEPVIPSAVMATAILTAWSDPARQAELLPALASGERIFSLAWQEADSRHNPARLHTTAERDSDGYLLHGRKCLVWHGGRADAWIVSSRLDDGLALFLVPRDAAGVQVAAYPTMDGLQAADINFNGVRLPAPALLVAPHQGLAALEHGLDHGIAALCANATGAMEKLIEITTDYLRTRHQFGKPLATFQVLQHRVADMLVQKELALSMAYVAAQALDESDPAARRRMLAGAKITAARAGRLIGQQAVQLHGGMGMTDDLPVGDYFKHLTLCDPLLGDSDHHIQRYSAVLAHAEPYARPPQPQETT